jgi:ubiquitin-protein ligase
MKAFNKCLKLEWLPPHMASLGTTLDELAEQATAFQIAVGGRDGKGAAKPGRVSNGKAAGNPVLAAEQAEQEGLQQLRSLADLVHTVAEQAKKVLQQPMQTDGSEGAAAAAAGGCSAGSASAAYSSHLSTHRFAFVEALQSASTAAAAAGKAGASAARGSSTSGGGAKRLRRLATEAASAQKDLPLEVSTAHAANRRKSWPLNVVSGCDLSQMSSSCFVRVDETHIDHWHAMITGPEDTPYEGGCFIFDINCSTNYPQSPPKVLLLTTGGGRVRFNPNLYNCGKVCLSLLGTWQGAAGETWDPNVSSLLQVLVSIQSLIL